MTNALTDEERRQRHRERERRRYSANPQKKIERDRKYRAANLEKVREKDRRYYAANLEKVLEKRRRYHAANPGRNMRWFHRMQPEDWAALWDAQAGRCYLCGNLLTRQTAVIDHDHACCPPDHSCRFCRRGLCCSNCNAAIGLAGDDPDQMERMAASLRAAKLAVARRMAGKPVQETLPGDE